MQGFQKEPEGGKRRGVARSGRMGRWLVTQHGLLIRSWRGRGEGRAAGGGVARERAQPTIPREQRRRLEPPLQELRSPSAWAWRMGPQLGPVLRWGHLAQRPQRPGQRTRYNANLVALGWEYGQTRCTTICTYMFCEKIQEPRRISHLRLHHIWDFVHRGALLAVRCSALGRFPVRLWGANK